MFCGKRCKIADKCWLVHRTLSSAVILIVVWILFWVAIDAFLSIALKVKSKILHLFNSSYASATEITSSSESSSIQCYIA